MTREDIYDRIESYRAPLGEPHISGRCGGHADLCQDCYEQELDVLQSFASSQPGPLPDEGVLDYWRRIDGPMLDAWCEAASRRVRAARGEG